MLTYLFSTARLLLYYTSIVLQLISEIKNVLGISVAIYISVCHYM